MADFRITPPEPFTVLGSDGKTVYEMPRLRDLSADQLGTLDAMREAVGKGLPEQVDATRAFLLGLCPGLGQEPITDMGFMALFNELAKGSGIDVGES